MNEIRVALAYETFVVIASGKNMDPGRKTKIVREEKKLLEILTSLGYQKDGALWISPPGREANLLSTLSFQLYSNEIGRHLKNLTVVKIADSILDVLDNIRKMCASTPGELLKSKDATTTGKRASVKSSSGSGILFPRLGGTPEKKDRFTDNFTGMRH